MKQDRFNSLKEFNLAGGRKGRIVSLPSLEAAGIAKVSRLPVTIRVILESVLRNCDGERITEDHVRAIANWKPNAERTEEVPFVVARILLQDFTGVPLLVDLAAMRSAVSRFGKSPKLVEPLVPVDLVVDHSVQVDFSGTPDALGKNLDMEFKRNGERYKFLKWGMQAFDGFRVVPPGIGIVHQVNLEYLAKGVLEKDGVYYPDTLVGTDSHTTMINGLGIVGWGVGGIEAEAGMLGQPIYFLTPDVVAVHMSGKLREGVTATDLALHITQMLRKEKVVGKFVEYIGEGAASLSLADRATVSNMSPEYGATMGFFPIDEESCAYLENTGRSREQVDAVRSYFQAQGMFGIPGRDDCDYTKVVDLDLGSVEPSVAGPRRPQDRIPLPTLKKTFIDLLTKPLTEGGYGLEAGDVDKNVEVSFDGNGTKATMGHGNVVIAAITSCTNTSNPSVMLAAGLVAKKANARGLKVAPYVKTSLAPGSRVVTDYLNRSELQPELDKLGFNLVGYGCTTCIGNSGPLREEIETAIVGNQIVASSVLSGNRNFEARVHQNVKANFLMSPPLVVAFAIAGTTEIDMSTEPLGKGSDGKDVYLRDIWPSLEEIRDVMRTAMDPATFNRLYRDFADQNPKWQEVPSSVGDLYDWAPSTYIEEPPFFEGFGMEPAAIEAIRGARPLAIFGDSVTTDHISPAGAIKPDSPAGRYLKEHGVEVADFNSYGSRRGNDRVMTRGTFANVRIKNRMVPGVEGGVTVHQPSGERMAIYDAAMKYREAGIPLVVLAAQEYGTGSSRDWAAKGTQLLGVRAVIASSFERIHRSNLIGMGVLPCQFAAGTSPETLGLDGTEVFDLDGVEGEIHPQQKATLRIHRADGRVEEHEVSVRLDTPIEVDYYRHGGILPFVARQLIAAS